MTLDLSALQADLDSLPKAGRGGTVCALQALVKEHPEAEETLLRAIADHTRSAARVAEVLTRNGLQISETSIKRHRKGGCQQCRKAAAQ